MKSAHLIVAILATLAISSVQARSNPQAAATAAQRDASWQRHQQLQNDSQFHGLSWRSIGPTVQGGRVVDVESVPGEPYTFYVAYASGGVWKTVNNGVTFEPLTDQLSTMISGDLAVDAKNTQRVWLGSGEPNSSRSSYGGMGVFLSEDAGKTWQNRGLKETDRIGRISLDPRDGNKLCVAALGKLYSTGGQRGVYCTNDAGATWSQTLKNENAWTGAIDLARDPKNPDVIYAATWERSRSAWEFVEGGAGSGIWKSIDNGATWTRLANGLPQGKIAGRIGLAISESQPNTVYATLDNWEELPESMQDLGDAALSPKRLKKMSKDEFLRQDIEAIEDFIRGNDFHVSLDAKGLIAKIKADEISVQDLVNLLNDAEADLFNTDIRGLEVYRSDDAGASWKITHAEPIREVSYTYGYYFGLIAVAPDNVEQVYIAGVPMLGSSDGGKTWTSMQDPDVHVDYHAWWIDKNFPKRMIAANDGGVDISYDGGKSWLKLDAQPVGQFYTVMVDMAQPYNVYGGLQDNGTYKGASTTRWELGQDWTFVSGGDGMYVAVDTRDNKTLYTGYQFGYYARSGPDGRQDIRPREKLGETPLRYNWNSPVILSEHNQDIVYFGTNFLFRSMDQGENYTAISPDLSRSKNRGNVPFATLTSVSESNQQFGLIWAGSDDGQVWLTQNGGNTWSDVGGNLPKDRWVSRVHASAHEKGTAYLSLNGYRNDDIAAYVYLTKDFGKSWQSIAAGLPAEAVNVVRDDPVNANVVYVGTDRGVYVSIDKGANWQALQQDLPNVPVHDLIVHPRERELVAGTHGRSVWIVDVLPVQDLTAEVQKKSVHVFPVSALQADRGWRGSAPRWFDDRAYLPKLKVPYWAKSDGEAVLSILDKDKNVLREIRSAAKTGINHLEWDLMLDKDLALAAEKAVLEKAATEKAAAEKDASEAKSNEPINLSKTPVAEAVRLGHRLFALPGEYTVQLKLNGERSETALKVKAPEARKPRAKPAQKIRGRDDGLRAQAAPPPLPISKSKTKPL